MSVPRIALVTARVLAEPDPDMAPLARALEALGARATAVAWDDAGTDWGAFDAIVVRSAWDYVPRRDAFCAWADRAASRARLFNPPDVVRWNTDKRYLADLEARGVPVVPTLWAGGADLSRVPWDDVVLKPRVSAASFGTRRFSLGRERREAEAFLEASLRERAMMVQPYLASVEREGERALVWIDGALTHSVTKSPRFSGDAERTSAALPVDDEARALALAALEPLAARLLYARVDVARDGAGVLRVMELELVEPSLFLSEHPPALERFARAIAARAGVTVSAPFPRDVR